jgi:desulfoferrodoxin (superoxide reductase-like protein)
VNEIYSILLVALIVPVALQAHPPKDITAEFDNETKELAVTISHFVDDPVRHYIDKIVVELNGDEVITQKLAAQESNSEQRALYLITDAEEGDSISVTAYCSISGKKKVTIDVVTPEEEEIEE